mmetsp:Transcript_117903/g.338112  ORF Transcript_117903/g.338112 Transcript_117903/m.338112 type:complete len:156 (+) Transcript_117903:74-541(+)
MWCGCHCGEEKQKDLTFPAAAGADDQVCPATTPQSATAVLQSPGEDETLRDAPGTRFFNFSINKRSPDDKLGMDVKHISASSNSRLQIVQLFPEGAIVRTNAENAAASPPGEELRKGDYIVKVNDVEFNDYHMVAECKLRQKLIFRVARPPPSAS